MGRSHSPEVLDPGRGANLEVRTGARHLAPVSLQHRRGLLWARFLEADPGRPAPAEQPATPAGPDVADPGSIAVRRDQPLCAPLTSSRYVCGKSPSRISALTTALTTRGSRRYCFAGTAVECRRRREPCRSCRPSFDAILKAEVSRSRPKPGRPNPKPKEV